MEDDSVKKSLAWLQDIVQGNIGHGLDSRTLEGLRVIEAEKGSIRCEFIVRSTVSDVDGNWHVGAIASLIDITGAVAIYSVASSVISSVDFSVSYFSTAKIQEHVVIDAKVIANRGRLTQVNVEVRRKGNGELIAVGKQWMASNKLTISQRAFFSTCVMPVTERTGNYSYYGTPDDNTRITRTTPSLLKDSATPVTICRGRSHINDIFPIALGFCIFPSWIALLSLAFLTIAAKVPSLIMRGIALDANGIIPSS